MDTFSDVVAKQDEVDTILALHDKCEDSYSSCQCNKTTEDKCVQANTYHDSIRARMNVMDLLTSNKRLNSWTGIPNFELWSGQFSGLKFSVF